MRHVTRTQLPANFTTKTESRTRALCRGAAALPHSRSCGDGDGDVVANRRRPAAHHLEVVGSDQIPHKSRACLPHHRVGNTTVATTYVSQRVAHLSTRTSCTATARVHMCPTSSLHRPSTVPLTELSHEARPRNRSNLPADGSSGGGATNALIASAPHPTRAPYDRRSRRQTSAGLPDSTRSR